MTTKLKQVTINLKGIITATSDKQGKIKRDEPTKSVYITVDEETATKLEKMNLQKFTTKSDKVDFFILQVGQKIKKYGSDGLSYLNCSADGEQPNFDSQEKEVGLSLLYAQSEKSQTGTYVRLTAINDPKDNVKLVEDINPFDEDVEEDSDLPF